MDPVGKAEKLGCDQFVQGRYRESLSTLSKAVAACVAYTVGEIEKFRTTYGVPVNPPVGEKVHPRLCAIMDHRAACFEKLGNLKKALQESQKVCQLDPLNCKGYLRRGKLLCSMGRENEALELLARAIKRIRYAQEKLKVSVSKKLFDTLLQQCQTLSETESLKRPGSSCDIDELVPSKKAKKAVPSGDFCESLPHEIITRIMGMLSLHDILTCCTVSVKWNALIRSSPTLWQDIYFKVPVSFKSFSSGMKQINKAHRNRECKSIKRLKVRPRQSEEREIVKQLFGRFPLSYKRLDLTLNTIPMADIFRMTDNKWGSLNLENLTTLQIQIKYSKGDLHGILSKMPSLTTLELRITQIHSTEALEETAGEWPNMKSLAIQGCSHASEDIVDYIKMCKFPNLQALRLSHANLDDVKLAQVLYGCNYFGLHHLALEQMEGLRLQDVITKLSKVWESLVRDLNAPLDSDSKEKMRLISLVVTEKSQNERQNLEDVELCSYPSLKDLSVLDISGCAITFKGLWRLLSCCGPVISRLFLGNCSKLVFPRSGFDVRLEFGEIYEIFNRCKRLDHLYLNNSTDLNDFSLKQFGEAIVTHENKISLDTLDLSNNAITGRGLMDLFQYSDKLNRTRIKQGSSPLLQIKNLIVDGTDIDPSTIALLQRDKFVHKVSAVMQRY